MGNPNAGTGIGDLSLCFDNHISQLLPDTNSIQDEIRCFCDDKINSYGRILLKLCNSHNLKIANGPTHGDRVGNYTCFNRGVSSVVDYLLVENSIHQKVENLKFYLLSLTQNIHPLLLLSELRL